MKTGTLYVRLTYSPILARYARGVYGLVGADFPPGAAQALIPPKVRTKVLHDYGWTSDQGIWIKYRLSESLAKSGVCSVPSAMSAYVKGSFTLLAEDGLAVGSFVADKASGWGLGSLFRRRGGEPGDFLVLRFDIKGAVCTAYLREQEPDVEALIESLESGTNGAPPPEEIVEAG